MTDYGLDLAVIGNGRTAALLEPSRASCGGAFRASTAIRCSAACSPATRRRASPTSCSTASRTSKSDYVRNTPIVVTELTDEQRRRGPHHRFRAALPEFRPHLPCRRNSSASSSRSPALPRITIRFRPTHNYGDADHRSRRSAAITSATGAARMPLRLTTDAPLSYIEREASFVLTRPIHMVFGTDEPFAAALGPTCRDFLDRTRDYWREWVRRLDLSYDWQDAIIRAAITLKLSNFEETGGIVAALTTSIPEAPGSRANWDYRFCWLRDAYFVVKALNRIGATRTMEDFISYILDICCRTTPRRSGRSTASCRPTRWTRRIARASRRLSRRRTGAHRQCRGRSDAARHLWQHHPRGDADVLRPPAAADGRRGAVSTCSKPLGGKAAAARARARRRHLGISRPHSAFTPIRPRCAGPAATGWRRSRSISASPMRAHHWNDVADRHPRRDDGDGLEREARRLHRGLRQRRSRCQRAAAARTRRRSSRTIRASFRPSRRSSANFCAAITLCAMPAADDFGVPEAAF